MTQMTPFGFISRGDLDALVDALHGAHSPSTVARRVATLNGFLRWLAGWGGCDLPPIPTPHVELPLPTVLDRGGCGGCWRRRERTIRGQPSSCAWC